jgi:hypothetical protein
LTGIHATLLGDISQDFIIAANTFLPYSVRFDANLRA